VTSLQRLNVSQWIQFNRAELPHPLHQQQSCTCHHSDITDHEAMMLQHTVSSSLLSCVRDKWHNTRNKVISNHLFKTYNNAP